MNKNDKLKAAEEEIKRLKAENARLRETRSSSSTTTTDTSYEEAMANACCGMDYASIDSRWPNGDPGGYDRYDRQ